MSMQVMQEQEKTAGDAGEPLGLLDFYPEDQPPFLVRAWLDCLLWSLRSEKPNFVEAFTAETGVHLLRLARTPLEAMIDQATGHTPAVQMRTFMESYAPWFNANVWGDLEASGEDNEAERAK